MREIQKKIKENYKLLVPVITILLLGIVLFFFLKIYSYNIYRDSIKVNAYKEVVGDKIEFSLILYVDKNDIVREIKAEDKKINFDSNPIYYKDDDKVFFPTKMSVVFPFEDHNQYIIEENTIFEKDYEINYLQVEGKKKEYLNYFIYDGEDLYFFIDEVVININDNTYKKISAMSYISLVGDTLIYYDKETDKSEVIELKSSDMITIKNEYINIDLRSDKVGKNRILTSDFTTLTNISQKEAKSLT